jgi:hypothetical protein
VKTIRCQRPSLHGLVQNTHPVDIAWNKFDVDVAVVANANVGLAEPSHPRTPRPLQTGMDDEDDGPSPTPIATHLPASPASKTQATFVEASDSDLADDEISSPYNLAEVTDLLKMTKYTDEEIDFPINKIKSLGKPYISRTPSALVDKDDIDSPFKLAETAKLLKLA